MEGNKEREYENLKLLLALAPLGVIIYRLIARSWALEDRIAALEYAWGRKENTVPASTEGSDPK